MYNIDDVVVYGMTGVCRIADIQKQEFTRHDIRSYYVLKPVHAENSTIYAPVDSSDDKLRYVLTKEQVTEIIKTVGKEPPAAQKEYNKEDCLQIMKSDDRGELMRLVRSLDKAKKETLQRGRKFRVAEENIMKTACKLICDEFSLALGIGQDEVLPIVLSVYE